MCCVAWVKSFLSSHRKAMFSCFQRHLQHWRKLKELLIVSPIKADARQRSLELRQGNLDRHVARNPRTAVQEGDPGAPILVVLGYVGQCGCFVLVDSLKARGRSCNCQVLKLDDHKNNVARRKCACACNSLHNCSRDKHHTHSCLCAF